MPVLLKGREHSGPMYPDVDVDALVKEVRDRLCLKSREKYCSSRRSAAPYNVNKRHHANHNECCCKKHHSSPESYSYQTTCKSKQTFKGLCVSRSCRCARSSKIGDMREDNESPRILLEKLIAEQSLIQEAVRRLQSRPLKSFSSSKIFPFDDEDSCDQFSGQTQSYSESEDDSVSQHSLDL